MNLSNDPAKIEIVSRLVKEGAIDFTEAIKLLEEPEIHFDIPFKYPDYPVYPQWPNEPWRITCYDKTNSPVINGGTSTCVTRMTGDEILTFTNSHLQ